MKKVLTVVLLLTTLPAVDLAQNITGTVTNGTTNKPGANADVTLLSLSQGMNEIGTAKSDAQGRFTLKLDNENGPHLVRVNYQGVNYFKMVPPGMNTADVKVYDAAKKVDGITGTVNVVRYQAESGSLQVVELYALNNASVPPRTLMSQDKTFEITLPANAKIDGGSAQSPGGQPINASPVPQGNGKYAFIFPIRPGETRFQVEYHLPYSGEFTWSPKPSMPLEHFVVVLPKTMSFEAKQAARFSPMPDESGTTVQVATNAKPGEDLSFRIAGMGSILDEQQASGGGAPAGGQQGRDGRPGGGLGAPIDAPDALAKYRWPILAGFAVALVVGAFMVMKRSAPTPVAAAVPSSTPTAATAAPVAAQPRSTQLLDAMKEELFQLEIERQQGKISEADYKSAKAALDQTLQRALARAKTSS